VRKSYLVTGGAGFIGSHVCDALVAEGHRVTVLDNFCSGRVENLSDLIGKVTLIEGDVRDLASRSAEIGRVDTVIHLAALISGYDSLAEPDSYEDVNLRGLLRVIEYAVEHKVGRILFASSSTIYGNQGAAGLRETTPPEPLTVYALTKLAGEHLLRLYGLMHGFSHCSLRLFNVYGPRQATDHPYANVTCKFSHAAAWGLPVKLFGDGEQSRDFVFVSDVVRAFMAVRDTSSELAYNVGFGRSVPINSLIRELEQVCGRAMDVEHCPAWPNDIRTIRADVSRLEAEFGLRPVIDIPEGLAATVAYFRSRSGQ
jgi:UDP-glucose 4-epimerase